MPLVRRLISVAHSYVVSVNRRLLHELRRVGERKSWEVVGLAPRAYPGDLGPITLALDPAEVGFVRPSRVFVTIRPHVFVYGRELVEALRERWDVIHLWQEPFTASAAETARLARPEARIVVSTYQNISKCYPPPFSWFERSVMDRCSGWVAGGRTIYDALAPRPGYRTRPACIVPMGVDVEAFRPEPEWGTRVRDELEFASDGPPIVGYLGRFVPEKGVLQMVAALERLRTPYRALFVGGGPCEAALRSFAASQGDRVRVVTGVPHDDVPRYLNAMDVLCAPSQTIGRWREQFGRMIVEAYACGVPVISSDSGEIPYTMAGAGVVVPEKEVEPLRRAMETLLESPDRRRALAEAGRQVAMERYAWPLVAQRLFDFSTGVSA